ncbi:MAG: hypothetical protein BWY77_01439 [bacterium ADurb.Bin431]|nr:MAG: hypothetical protein BWY77_01439 [bacterium ADurb.Bin431]
MGVDIDKAGADGQALGVNDLRASLIVETADSGDAVAADADIRPNGCAAAAVIEVPVDDEQVVGPARAARYDSAGGSEQAGADAALCTFLDELTSGRDGHVLVSRIYGYQRIKFLSRNIGSESLFNKQFYSRRDKKNPFICLLHWLHLQHVNRSTSSFRGQSAMPFLCRLQPINRKSAYGLSLPDRRYVRLREHASPPAGRSAHHHHLFFLRPRHRLLS